MQRGTAASKISTLKTGDWHHFPSQASELQSNTNRKMAACIPVFDDRIQYTEARKSGTGSHFCRLPCLKSTSDTNGKHVAKMVPVPRFPNSCAKMQDSS